MQHISGIEAPVQPWRSDTQRERTRSDAHDLTGRPRFILYVFTNHKRVIYRHAKLSTMKGN